MQIICLLHIIGLNTTHFHGKLEASNASLKHLLSLQ